MKLMEVTQNVNAEIKVYQAWAIEHKQDTKPAWVTSQFLLYARHGNELRY